MYLKLVLKNDFHNSEAVFRVQHFGEVKAGSVIELSVGQVKKAHKLLCGIESCLCSGELGTRGSLHELDGREISIEETIYHNNITGQITGAELYIYKIW